MRDRQKDETLFLLFFILISQINAGHFLKMERRLVGIDLMLWKWRCTRTNLDDDDGRNAKAAVKLWSRKKIHNTH